MVTSAAPAVTAPVAYATFDGLFQQGLLKLLAGQEQAVDELEAGVRHELSRTIV